MYYSGSAESLKGRQIVAHRAAVGKHFTRKGKPRQGGTQGSISRSLPAMRANEE
jgi:hypothetical protein